MIDVKSVMWFAAEWRDVLGSLLNGVLWSAVDWARTCIL